MKTPKNLLIEKVLLALAKVFGTLIVVAPLVNMLAAIKALLK